MILDDHPSKQFYATRFHHGSSKNLPLSSVSREKTSAQPGLHGRIYGMEAILGGHVPSDCAEGWNIKTRIGRLAAGPPGILAGIASIALVPLYQCNGI